MCENIGVAIVTNMINQLQERVVVRFFSGVEIPTKHPSLYNKDI